MLSVAFNESDVLALSDACLFSLKLFEVTSLASNEFDLLSLALVESALLAFSDSTIL